MPLNTEQRREAVGLLAQLLLDAARKHEGVVSGGGFDGVLGGASGGVAPLPDEGVRAGGRRDGRLPPTPTISLA